MKKSMVLKMEVDFEKKEDFELALEELALLLKAWDNKWQKDQKNKIKYFVHEE